MTGANYDRFFEILGKLCNVYDNAGSSATTQNLQLYRTLEQASQADQESNDLPQLTIIASNVGAWQSAIAGGATRLQSLMVQIGQALVTNADFTAAIITAPGIAALTDKSNAKTVLTALGVEMAAAQDNKKINTLTTTGLANFLNKIAGATITWNTAAGGAADYQDSVYVVATIV